MVSYQCLLIVESFKDKVSGRLADVKAELVKYQEDEYGDVDDSFTDTEVEPIVEEKLVEPIVKDVPVESVVGVKPMVIGRWWFEGKIHQIQGGSKFDVLSKIKGMIDRY